MMIDKLMYKNNIFKKSLISSAIVATSYYTYNFTNDENNFINDENNYNDLRPKKSRCDKELTEFGNCLEKYNNSEKCVHLLEAYKRCLQQKI